MEKARLTARAEDYLEEIFLLECTGRKITVTEVAARLGLKKATVTAAVRKLVDENLLRHERYGAIYLTEDGRKKGLTVYRRHEGLRAFLCEILGVDRERSSEMACGMEHYMDAVTDRRLFAMLEFFRYSRAGQAPWIDEMFAAMGDLVDLPSPLSVLKNEQKGIVLRLSAEDGLRRKLREMGFVGGARVTCLDASFADSVTAAVNGSSFVLPRGESAAVWLHSVR